MTLAESPTLYIDNISLVLFVWDMCPLSLWYDLRGMNYYHTVLLF